MASLAEENYLKALYTLAGDRGEVTVKELSAHLAIKMPTANSMIKRLAEKELVEYESYKPLRLTDSGRKLAAQVVRKHRLTEMFLVEVMHFGWEEVHDIAEQIEHIQSPAFFDKMDELLNYPGFDPHGSPIPDKAGRIPAPRGRRLSEKKRGEEVEVCGVLDSDAQFLAWLSQKGIQLGSKLQIVQVDSFAHVVTVRNPSGEELALSSRISERLLVD